MKKFLNNIGIITIMFGVLVCTQMVFAGTFSSTLPTTPNYQFIDTSSINQTKQGWLKLGATGDPTTTLQVAGLVTATNALIVGNTTIGNKAHIGGSTPTVATDPTLVVESAYIRSSPLANAGKLCVIASGLIKSCGNAPVSVGVCGSSSIQNNPNNPPVSIAPITGLCSTGTASAVTLNTTTNTYTWTCTLGTTTPTACSVPKISPTTTCGTAAGIQTATSPTAGLCSGLSTASSVTFNTTTNNYEWTCSGTPLSSCTAPKSVIIWNSSACTTHAQTAAGTATTFYPFSATCPYATLNGVNITTYEKEVDGVVSSISNVFQGSSTVILPSSITGGNPTPSTEVVWAKAGTGTINKDYNGTGVNHPGYDGTLKTFRVRAVSGSLISPWSRYWSGLSPEPNGFDNNNTVMSGLSTTSSFTPMTPNKNLKFNWNLASNESTGSKKVVSYQLVACTVTPGGKFTCYQVHSQFNNIAPGISSVTFTDDGSNPFGQSYVYLSNIGTTSNPDFTCKYKEFNGSGYNTPIDCNFYIRGFLDNSLYPDYINNMSSSVSVLPPYTFTSFWTKFK